MLCVDTMRYYLTLKGKEILIHATTWMNLKNIMRGEISQTQKEKTYDSIYMKYLE